MDHEAYESQMFDDVNRHGKAATPDIVDESWDQVVTKDDRRVVARGLKRVLLALLTAAMFAIAVIGLIAVATAPGYLAVLLFFASILALAVSFILLYAQGITSKAQESKGESK